MSTPPPPFLPKTSLFTTDAKPGPLETVVKCLIAVVGQLPVKVLMINETASLRNSMISGDKCTLIHQLVFNKHKSKICRLKPNYERSSEYRRSKIYPHEGIMESSPIDAFVTLFPQVAT